MPAVLSHILKLFADDSKLIGIIRNHDDIRILQEDLDALGKWAKDWRMLFHPDKCKVMEISNSKTSTNARILLTMVTNDSSNRHALAETTMERDLVVLISNNLKFDQQSKHAAAKVLGQLKRTFKYWTPTTFKTLFTAYVRPHLEYAAPAWSPYRKNDIKVLEAVQRRASKLAPSLKHLNYPDRLNCLNLPTLEERRIRSDLIKFF